jgi:RimJ/RimL family protein N-acetyltransferase
LSNPIRKLVPSDAAVLLALRRAAIQSDPYAFGASPEDDRGSDLDFIKAALADDEQAVFGSYADGRLTGLVGIVRQRPVKRRHKAIVWGMYVSPEYRGKGVGKALLSAAVAHARTWPGVTHVHLSVTETSVAAKALYESLGFRVWGCEPAAHGWEGRLLDEYHLILNL